MAHHEPLKALGPIDWADVAGDDLNHFLTTTFSCAQIVIDSIPPLPASANTPQQQSSNGRARSHTEGSVPSQPSDDPAGRDHANTTDAAGGAADALSAAHAAQLRKEWKEVKVPPRDNPMGISVFKLGGKDGRGAWFARRSLHAGVPFDKFRLGLEREFGETLRNKARGPVRGIGAERRAEHRVCDGGVGAADVWLLSAQFPGPTTPRDFLTLLLTGASGCDEGEGEGKEKGPRQFMVVSRPCDHPECQPRPGFIRGTYESVEIIREVPVEKPMRRARSSTDVKGEELQLPHRPAHDVGPEGDREMSRSLPRLSDPGAQDDSTVTAEPETEMAIEWVMVTRSDPGGSVPRFMVEKGTPGGIVSDAGRFIKWLDSKKIEDLKEDPIDELKEAVVENNDPEAPASRQVPSSADGAGELPVNADLSSSQEDVQPSGFYNMIAGAFGAVSSRLPGFSTSASGVHTDSDNSYSDSEGSERSFASAQEPEPEPEPEVLAKAATAENESMHSTKSDESSSKTSTSQHEKALKKLQERQKKVEEKITRQQERSAQSKQNQGDDTLARLREKHEKELARQEENYRKEVKKIEEKRLKEEKKAEEKRRKQQEKEERENVSMQLEKTRAERDVALKQVEILKEQVGLLQAQNTKLVAQLDKEAAANGVLRLDEEKLSQTSSGSK
ncbi:hypothetical protein VSDG_04438 [Cytospora chrysosperma]|uniref:DUF3074 domain-containing protein n=1 Tax=Cytospora chrysosperma TaxID=252740 RepID=A0A423W4F5_CYTCH|nr:hypothetical protein VSDG_04438 [Valsa sordida]